MSHHSLETLSLRFKVIEKLKLKNLEPDIMPFTHIHWEESVKLIGKTSSIAGGKFNDIAAGVCGGICCAKSDV